MNIIGLACVERSSLLLYSHVVERVIAVTLIHSEVLRVEERTKTHIPLLFSSHRVCIENVTSRFPSGTAVQARQSITKVIPSDLMSRGFDFFRTFLKTI